MLTSQEKRSLQEIESQNKAICKALAQFSRFFDVQGKKGPVSLPAELLKGVSRSMRELSNRVTVQNINVSLILSPAGHEMAGTGV